MSARFVLVRHGSCALTPEVLLGRAVDAPLAPAGQAEAQAAAGRLRGLPVRRVDSSPRLRTRQTAAAIAAACGARVQVSAELDELDFGRWAGQRFADLEADPDWRHWNAERGTATTPAGDSMAAAHARALGWMRAQGGSGGDGIHVLVTHAEVIRALLLSAMGLSFSDWHRVEVAPGSSSRVWLEGEQVVCESFGKSGTGVGRQAAVAAMGSSYISKGIGG